MTWVESSGGKAILRVWVQPRAAKAAIVGVHGDALKIKLTSPPVEGQANDQLINLLAKTLRVPASSISLRSGQTGRRKVVEIVGLPVETIRDRLS